IQAFANKVVNKQTIDSTNASNIPMEEAMFANRMSVTELLESDWSYDIGDDQKMEDTTQPHVQNADDSHTNNSKQNVDEGEASSSSNIRVYARKLKKKRKYLIDADAEGNTDEDTNNKPNLKLN
ncbi:hypothetical protein EJD97_025829, partial [Solanum chilense]